MKNLTMRQLIDEVPSDDFLMTTTNQTTGKVSVHYGKKMNVVAEFNDEDEAEKYIGDFNGRRRAIQSARGLRSMLGL